MTNCKCELDMRNSALMDPYYGVQIHPPPPLSLMSASVLKDLIGYTDLPNRGRQRTELFPEVRPLEQVHGTHWPRKSAHFRLLPRRQLWRLLLCQLVRPVPLLVDNEPALSTTTHPTITAVLLTCRWLLSTKLFFPFYDIRAPFTDTTPPAS